MCLFRQSKQSSGSSKNQSKANCSCKTEVVLENVALGSQIRALCTHQRERSVWMHKKISPYLFLPESLKPLAKGFLSIFNLVIYGRRIRELAHLLKKIFFFQQIKIMDDYHSFPRHLYDYLLYVFPQIHVKVTLHCL